MTEHDELDTELRRLFADDRLDIRPDEAAPARVLAGARRIRRRRAALTATGGTLTAVVLVTAGLLLGPLRPASTNTAAPVEDSTTRATGSSAPLTANPVNPAPGSQSTAESTGSTGQSEPSRTPARSSSSAAPPTTASSRGQTAPLMTGAVLGPDGYSKLVLGMSFADAKKTGLLAGAGTAPSGCAGYRLTEGSASVSVVTISDTNGVVGFDATGAHTPERIRIGSTKDELEAAYPGLSKNGSTYTADAGGGGSYVFAVDDSNHVSTLQLVASTSC
ncbi:RodZ family helix-turn-helix domain-containing protein [Amycolatopsis alkalitolerans]|uniref:Uncharacterized protein n=1 Tax=Amycolatopsis alkalitolerans TaxID=2547244 RepID=A0A5C4M444_9PSEU|nr:hypothetical protein [Amycolatopsis alkalitolerans]TNC27377.1 hypothetical protein FG385_09910 [Amycolatopsis alkalitolerans]